MKRLFLIIFFIAAFSYGEKTKESPKLKAEVVVTANDIKIKNISMFLSEIDTKDGTFVSFDRAFLALDTASIKDSIPKDSKKK